MKLSQVNEVGVEHAMPIWDFREQIAPNSGMLKATLDGQRRELIHVFSTSAPVAWMCNASISPPYCRRTMHRRAICIGSENAGAVPLKGTDPRAADLSSEVKHIEPQRTPFLSSMLNDFATSEHKGPVAFESSDAVRAVPKSLGFQQRCWEGFGGPARASTVS